MMKPQSKQLRAVALLAGLAVLVLAPPPAWAQAFGYSVDIQVPQAYRRLLEENLDIVKWRDNPRMDLAQLRRLFRGTPESIGELMATEGYYSPAIRSSLEQRDGAWVARFDVEPGEPSRVARVDIGFRGAIADDSPRNLARIEKAKKAWRLAVGAVFRQEGWEAAKRSLLRGLLVDRYPAASIASSRATVDPEKREVYLEVVADSGPAFTLGRLEITGLKRYPRRVVENLNPIEPGSPYSQQKLLGLQARLQDSGYFASSLVSAEADPARPHDVPIRVEVVENPSKHVGFGIGFSSNTGARGQVDYRDLNLLNRAWRLNAGLKLETKTQSATADIYLPAKLADYQDSLGVKLERTDIEGDVTTQRSLGVKRSRMVGKIETALAAQYQAERETVAGAESSTSRALTLNYSWIARRTDDPLYPNRGYLLNLQVGGGLRALLSDQDFVRGYGRLAYYHPLGPRDTVMLRGELGGVLASSRDGIPSEFLFRAGGDQSLRGYDYQSLGVRQGDAVVGGRYLAIASAEYVHWLTPKWGAALFYDVGDAVDSLRDYKAVQGYGVGARWRSPVGPLNLDLAYGRELAQYRVYFSVGFVF